MISQDKHVSRPALVSLSPKIVPWWWWWTMMIEVQCEHIYIHDGMVMEWPSSDGGTLVTRGIPLSVPDIVPDEAYGRQDGRPMCRMRRRESGSRSQAQLQAPVSPRSRTKGATKPEG